MSASPAAGPALATGTGARDRAGTGEPLLKVRSLSVGLPGTMGPDRITRDVDFALHRGETLGIVGESGSGKSLTARAITGLLPGNLSASGALRYAGRDLSPADPDALTALRGASMGMLFQDPFTMLNPLLRSGEHVAEGLRRHSGHRSGGSLNAEVRRRLAEVGIEDARIDRRYPFELSGGLRQRVGLAAALAGDPELLIADEPSTALDVTTQAEVLRLLRCMRDERGLALLLITHDLRLAFSICDRVLVLYAGSLVEVAPSAALREVPRHPYTQGLLLSEPPVERRLERLYSMPGRVPSAGEIRDACSFSPRCEWAAPVCRTTPPPLRGASADHLTACLRIDEIGDAMRARRFAAGGDARADRRSAGSTVAPLVSVRGLDKSFGASAESRTRVLHSIDLEIRPGECVGLVGESGSGKTTLGRCLLGLETVDGGTILVDGHDLTRARALDAATRARLRRAVQIVFQDPYSTLNPKHRIRRCLAEALRAAGVPKPWDARIDALLDRVGLTARHADARPAALSGGERQRVAIARALAVEPRLVVFDEPVSALDVSVQAQVLNLLADLGEGLSSLFITHDLAVVRQVADRIYVLYRGRIVEHGPAEQVLSHPRHAYTRQLIAAIP